VNHLWRADADGSNPVQLTQGGGEVNPICSTDSSWVGFLSEREGCGDGNICKVPLAGGAVSELAPGSAYNAALKDDKSLFTFEVDPKEPKKVIGTMFMLDGSAPPAKTNLPFALADARDGRWVPGKNEISYIDTRSSTPNIWSSALSGKPPVQLTRFTAGRIFSFAWAPDGSKLAVSHGTVTSDVVLFSRSENK
jgi:Tol biopolymer transport system component